MTITLSEVFDEHFKNTKFNSKLAKNIYQFQIGYVNRNQEHMEFFGGNLLGVQVVRFKDSDLSMFFNDTIDIDYVSLERDLSKVTTINHEFKISSDTLNLTCIYMIHRFFTSPLISDKERERAVYDVALVFFYRCIAALISDRFRYPADPKIAQAAYAALSQKFLIKKLGSWNKVMDYRAKDLVLKNGLHYKKLVSFNNDQDIVYVINDAQGRVRDIIKGYYNEFKKTHSEGLGIATTSSVFLDIEGEETTKDKIGSTESRIAYIKSIISDKNSFVKDDLVAVISKINTNTSFRMMKMTLEWLSDNYNSEKYHKDIDDFLVKIIIHSFHLIQYNLNTANLRDYPRILLGLKNLYLSTRSTDEDLMEIRDIGERLIKNSTKDDLSNSLIMSTRTSIILYITFRTLTGSS